MKWVQGIDESLFVSDGDAVLPDEQKLRMRNSELLAVSSPNRKRPKPAAQPLLQFLHIHILNVKQCPGASRLSSLSEALREEGSGGNIQGMTSRYDAIIIGAGHNGLVTAAYLARADERCSSWNAENWSEGVW